MTNKTIYIITGNQDGVLEAATNIKAAYRIAYDYTKHDNKNIMSYAQIVKRLNHCDHADLMDYDCTATSASIERLNLTTK